MSASIGMKEHILRLPSPKVIDKYVMLMAQKGIPEKALTRLKNAAEARKDLLAIRAKHRPLTKAQTRQKRGKGVMKK